MMSIGRNGTHARFLWQITIVNANQKRLYRIAIGGV